MGIILDLDRTMLVEPCGIILCIPVDGCMESARMFCLEGAQLPL